MSSRIYYTKPSITKLEVQYATDAAVNGWGEKCYQYIDRFESAFKKFLNVDYAIATSSCTGALHMGLAALGIGLGDEVIIADTNWIASAAPITYLGAKPIFVDIDKDSWCIDPKKIEAAITKKTKAIIAVHLYGNLCDMDTLLDISARHSIPLIEDSAEALGSVYKGKKAGSMGSFGVFSFHGTKTITTGEGGMFVTQNKEIYEKVLTLSNHGRSVGQSKQFWPDVIGYKYKISNMQAAVGCAQIERIDELLNRKREIFFSYKHALGHLPLKMNPEIDETKNSFWMPTIVIDEGVKFEREVLLRQFKEDQIDGRVFFWPLSMLPMFERADENINSYSICHRAINLPSYHDITSDDINRVCSLIKNFFK